MLAFKTGSALFLMFGIALLGSLGCTAKPNATSEIAKEEVRMSKLDVNTYPITKTICDPFGDQPDPRSNQGLKGELWWLTTSDPKRHNVGDMMKFGVKSGQSIFFSQLNVPTRLFNMGFANPTGATVKDDDGATLIEYFALRFKSILRLAPDQKPGLYEFAILSDDGAILNLRESDGVYRPNVVNDGDHPTRLGCGTTPIQMTAESEHPMYLDYYQGPRYHISMILLMREYRAGTKDPACGLTGNSTWFDYNNNSKPQKAYNDLLARGWKPLAKDNYALANEVKFNPCKDGETPVISNFKVVERFNDGFIVSWTTDIPATSQVVSTAPDGTQSISVSDNIMRTSHEIRVQNLNSNTVYGLQAVSISDTYGKSISDSISALTDY